MTLDIVFDITGEQTILSAALASAHIRRVVARKFPTDNPFGNPENAKLWDVLVRLEADDVESDTASIGAIASRKVADYAEAIREENLVIPANIDWHLDRLAWGRLRQRAVQGPIGALLVAIKDPDAEKQKVTAALRELCEIFRESDRTAFFDIEEVIVKQLNAMKRRRDGCAIYPFGFKGLDEDDKGAPRIIPGLAPGKITVLTGVSGSGKSTFAAAVVLNALKKGRKVLWGAWEMSPGTSLELIATMSLEYNRRLIAAGQFDKDAHIKLNSEMRRLSTHLQFLRIPELAPGEAKSWKKSNRDRVDRIVERVEASNCDLFVADLLRKGFVTYDPEEEELALNHMQARVDKGKAHHMYLQQQRLKDVEQRRDKRPTREGIKGSSAWVEVADTILGAHRDSLWKDIDDSTFEVDILKQRFGKWPVAVQFDWNGDYGTFKNGREIPYRISLDEGSGNGEFPRGHSENAFKTGNRRGKAKG